MNLNISSFLLYTSFNISPETMKSYFQSFLQILIKKGTNYISYISFHNYFNLCPFITTKLYNLFLHIDGSSTLSPTSFINGLQNLYLSDLETRIHIIFNLCDFDNDGSILVDDIKLLIKHFHYFSNTSDVSCIIKDVEAFFENKKSMKLMYLIKK